MAAHLPLDRQAFQARQQAIELAGVVDFPVRVAYTDIGIDMRAT